ncbi:hypothetical protein DU976_05980 [Vibrio navarrensis]|nr:hypothetical protein [Vibrio navarrensis]
MSFWILCLLFFVFQY